MLRTRIGVGPRGKMAFFACDTNKSKGEEVNIAVVPGVRSRLSRRFARRARAMREVLTGNKQFLVLLYPRQSKPYQPPQLREPKLDAMFIMQYTRIFDTDFSFDAIAVAD